MSSEISFISAGVTHEVEAACMHDLCASIYLISQISFHCKTDIESPVLVVLTLG